jgi:hypothetical protein
VYPVAEARPARKDGFEEDVDSRVQGMSFELSLLPGLANWSMADPLKESSVHSPVHSVAVQEQHLPMQLKPATVAIAVVDTSLVSSLRLALDLAVQQASLARACSATAAVLVLENAADWTLVFDVRTAVEPVLPET